MLMLRRSGGTTACADEIDLAADADLAAVGLEEARDHAQRRRLAAARRPEQADELAVGHREGQASTETTPA